MSAPGGGAPSPAPRSGSIGPNAPMPVPPQQPIAANPPVVHTPTTPGPSGPPTPVSQQNLNQIVSPAFSSFHALLYRRPLPFAAGCLASHQHRNQS